MSLGRITCNLDEKLIADVDAYADELHITRTAAVAVLLSRALQAERLPSTLQEFLEAHKRENKALKGKS